MHYAKHTFYEWFYQIRHIFDMITLFPERSLLESVFQYGITVWGTVKSIILQMFNKCVHLHNYFYLSVYFVLHSFKNFQYSSA